MSRLIPKSMRGRTTLISAMAVFIVLLVFSASLVFATQRILTNSARELLVEQVDSVELLIQEGTLPTSLTGLGTSLIQVIDADGNILAASSWATDLPALDTGTTGTGESSSEESENITWGGKGKGPGSGTGMGTGSGNGTGSGTGMGTGTGTGSGKSSDTSACSPTATDGSTVTDTSEELGNDILALVFDIEPAYAADTTTGTAASGTATTSGSTSESIGISDSGVFGDDGPYLIYRRGVESANGPLTIVAMASLSYAVESARTVGLVLLSIMPVALFVVAYSVWKITGKMLEPVEALRQRAEAISISDLDQRIDIPQNDMEIARLTKTFNEMLERVDDSVQDQRRFISDASHELKSPVAATRVMLETARDYPDIIEMETLIEDLSAENDRMAQIVSDLLFLARHDEGVRKLDLKRTDLGDLIAKEAADLTNRFGTPCDISGVQPIVCTLDEEAISRMLRNLLDNAARYANQGIWIECSQDEDAVRILISDDGIGIPEEDRERVFERFARLDEDRARSSGGTGLGLPVVRAIATQHRGTAQFIPPLHGGATVEITLSKNLH